MMRILCFIAVVKDAVAILSENGPEEYVLADRCVKGLPCKDDAGSNVSALEVVKPAASDIFKMNLAFENCEGSTVAGETNWQQAGPNSVSVEIDTSSCMWAAIRPGKVNRHGYLTTKVDPPNIPFDFTSTPMYEVTLQAADTKLEYGDIATSVKGSRDKVKVFVQRWGPDGNPLPIDVAEAAGWKWHIEWRKRSGTFDCVGRSSNGWTVYEHGIKMSVDTSQCGFTSTPKYFTSLGGISDHARTMGAGMIYKATPTGFEVRIRDLPLDRWSALVENFTRVNVQTATDLQWHINWVAHARGQMAHDEATGLDFETRWVSAEGLCVDSILECIDKDVTRNIPNRQCSGSIGDKATRWRISNFGPGSQMKSFCRKRHKNADTGVRIGSLRTDNDEFDLSPFQMNGGSAVICKPCSRGEETQIFPHYLSSWAYTDADEHYYWDVLQLPLDARGRVCSGRTMPLHPKWWQMEGNRATMEIDTSHCGFKSTPLYFTTFLRENHPKHCSKEFWIHGASSIYDPAPDHFRVHVYAEDLYARNSCNAGKEKEMIESYLNVDEWTFDQFFVFLFRNMTEEFESARGGVLDWIAIEEDASDYMPSNSGRCT